MASTISVTFTAGLTVVETFAEADWPIAQDRVVSFDGANTRRSLYASSTPPASKKYADELTGDQTLDLTALADPVSGTLDGTGLKVQAVKFVNLSTTATLTIAKGASNGYGLNGTGTIIVPPGGEFMAFFNDGLADVAAAVKTIDITITAGEDYQVVIVLG